MTTSTEQLNVNQRVAYESYHRTPEELDSIEAQTVEVAAALRGSRGGVVALAVTGENSFADFGRTYETNIFAQEDYDFHAAMEPYESHSIFLYTIDLDEGKIAHVKRMVEPMTPIEREQSGGLTGIEMIDDRLRSEVPAEKATLEEILEYHGMYSIDPSLNIATNMVTGRAVQTMSKPYTLMSYKAVFELTRQRQVTHILAYLNKMAVRSLAKIGVEDELLGGREFHLPLAGSTAQYDNEYVAVAIPYSRVNDDAFNVFNPEKPLTKLICDKEIPLLFA